MFTATDARSQTINSVTTETEIALINVNVIKAIESGNVTASINGNTSTIINNTAITGTPMTLDTNYYFAWQGVNSNLLAAAQMQLVVDNFTKLGYTISRFSTDGQKISWKLSW